ncbi:homogentisate 1,2-dioxygenase [Actinokineospora globicatena]|uniref:homogentisate 1,2-dioxygenase n=1 Tax=Actinokineospora globicatena TaxID=103729 RepID=UPI0020A4B7E5|nr:homogentisate 1,2-dioxygenase [Actinokineospora globicatena]MCP2301164.1 homogentisate 1,2-dioxygenase [Actinokineospora globicatena]GLW77200.1 homogentisate 1,2-dioxygenase [Actinokineospora globicatena]GLW84034.1 homogentisate 1,2-dioxygenase [Actinokineospora globicatena]
MPHYRRVGDIPRKRHTQFRSPEGKLYAEELMGVEGFSSDSALLYHRHLPTAIVNAEVVDDFRGKLVANHPLKPRHFRSQDLKFGADTDAVTGRRTLMGNSDVIIGFAVATTPSPLYRNAVGDELFYVQGGSGTVETIYGALEVSDGDYLVIPTSTTYRVVPNGELRLFIVEASGHIGPPKRYLSSKGQFLEHSPYCERDQRGPTEPLLVDGEDVDVLVRHRAGLTRFTYANHPFDVVGWDGCLYPWVFHINDFEPITGRVHQPPPVHQTFEGPNFVVCSFMPRKVDYHPDAIPVPYNHANVDSDELMFYVGGNYEARKGSGIGIGSLSLHPSGFTHGPQPGAAEASIGADYFDETAVMVDTFRPLDLGEAATDSEDPRYAWSWSKRGPDWS